MQSVLWGEDIERTMLMDEKEATFKKIFIPTFLAAWVANEYNDACAMGH